MPPRPAHLPPDLTDHWPDDPANDDLARLAQDLVSSRRELSTISLDRIHVRLRQEVVRVERRQTWMTIAAIFILAVAAFLGARAFITARTSSPATTDAPPVRDSIPIQDQFQVTLPAATPKTPQRPLIDLAPDRALFGEPTSLPSKP